MKISCGDGKWIICIRNAIGGANLVPAAAVIPDPGPYVAAGTVKAFDCPIYFCIDKGLGRGHAVPRPNRQSRRA